MTPRYKCYGVLRCNRAAKEAIRPLWEWFQYRRTKGCQGRTAQRKPLILAVSGAFFAAPPPSRSDLKPQRTRLPQADTDRKTRQSLQQPMLATRRSVRLCYYGTINNTLQRDNYRGTRRHEACGQKPLAIVPFARLLPAAGLLSTGLFAALPVALRHKIRPHPSCAVRVSVDPFAIDDSANDPMSASAGCRPAEMPERSARDSRTNSRNCPRESAVARRPE